VAKMHNIYTWPVFNSPC